MLYFPVIAAQNDVTFIYVLIIKLTLFWIDQWYKEENLAASFLNYSFSKKRWNLFKANNLEVGYIPQGSEIIIVSQKKFFTNVNAIVNFSTWEYLKPRVKANTKWLKICITIYIYTSFKSVFNGSVACTNICSNNIVIDLIIVVVSD